MTKAELLESITKTVANILRTGNSAPKLYLRVRNNGAVDVTEEASWCVSNDEYYKRVPHTLSLEVPRSTRDYSGLSVDEIAEQAECADTAAAEIVDGWDKRISEWIEAGNLQTAGK